MEEKVTVTKSGDIDEDEGKEKGDSHQIQDR